MNRITEHIFVRLLCLLALSLLVLTGCSGSDTPEPTATPFPQSQPQPISAPALMAAPEFTAAPSLTPSAQRSATPTAPTATPTVSGAVVADLGFRPETNGFSFQNYTNAKKYQNLTAVEMQRMFGDAVCANHSSVKCVLAPPVSKLMDQYNRAMSGGHCFGFSVLALRFAQNLANPLDFGAGNVSDLKIDGNDKLQREIAYSFAFQFFDPVNQNVIAGTPNQILDKLIAYFKVGPKNGESYTLGFFNAQGRGGHAVTPYAVEDLGGGKFAVQIYDNNLPDTEREMLFDRTADSWSYSASTNPNLASAQYVGDAKSQSLFLMPTSPGLKTQICPVCAATNGSKTLSAAPETYNAIFLQADPRNHGHLLITDDKGRRYGYLPDGTFVNEIPGAKHSIVFGQGTGTDLWNDDPEPIYYIPTGLALKTTLDGSKLKQRTASDVVVIGPGYYVGVENINQTPGQSDSLTLAANASHLSYKSGSAQAPNVVVGLETTGPDYAFTVHQVDMQKDGTLDVDLNAAKGQLGLKLGASNGSATYTLDASRIDTGGEFDLTHHNIKIGGGDTKYIEYGDWTGRNDALDVLTDTGSDGSIDQTESYDTGSVAPTPTPDENANATDTPDQPEEANPTPEEETEATATPEDIEATPTEYAESTPTPEDTVEATPTDYAESSPTPEDTVEATPTDYVESTPTPEDTVEATPTEYVEPTDTPEPEIEATPTPDGYGDATPPPEETQEPTPQSY